MSNYVRNKINKNILETFSELVVGFIKFFYRNNKYETLFSAIEIIFQDIPYTFRLDFIGWLGFFPGISRIMIVVVVGRLSR